MGGTCVAITNAEDADTCTGTQTCDATGACKRKQGQACTAATQCITNQCADGVCCNAACSGLCQYCNGGTPGTCELITGAPRSGHTGVCRKRHLRRDVQRNAGDMHAARSLDHMPPGELQ